MTRITAPTTARRLERQQAARAYLAETDWMVIREAETGKPMPDDVRQRRAAARQILSQPPE